MNRTKFFYATLAAAIAFAFSGPAISQNCGGGFVQEGGQGYTICVPIESYYPPQGVLLEDPGPQWASRWGAIAYDPVVGRFGGAENLASKAGAKKAAIRACKNNGGRQCKVMTQCYNQCGALAHGGNEAVASRGPDVSETIKNAVAACNAKGGNCQAYYAGCSFPVKIR
jgi:Domain of unknown function (DUF4189)